MTPEENPHYQLARKMFQARGRPHYGDDRLPQRFWDKVEPIEDGCWIWIGAANTTGYGSYWWMGKARTAHRFAYEVLLDIELHWSTLLDHLICRRRCCVNPAHLDPVTNRVNTMRGVGPTATRALGHHRNVH